MTSHIGFSHPLRWPALQPRTRDAERQAGSFGKVTGSGYAARRRELTIREATERLEAEARRMADHGGKGFTLHSDLRLRVDGTGPLSERSQLADPAVVLTFTLAGEPHQLACDRFRRVQDNMAALARFLDGLRASLRHGVMNIEGLLAGARCLPPPSDTQPEPGQPAPASQWRELLRLPADATLADARAARADWMKRWGQDHPDAWLINRAVEQAEAEMRV